MAQNEESLFEDGDFTRGIIDLPSGGRAVGLPSGTSNAGAASLPPIQLTPQNALATAPGQNGWIAVDYEWLNPTAFSALAGVSYTFFEGIVPANYRFVLRRMEAALPFDTQSVGPDDLVPFLPAQAHSASDQYLVLSMNGASVGQGLNNMDTGGVGASFQYAPTVFDLLAGFDLYRVFEENTQFTVSAIVTYAAINAVSQNSEGIKTRISGLLIPRN